MGSDCFPLATQRVASGAAGIGTPYDQGWCKLDLGLSAEGTVTADTDFPGNIAQSYVVGSVKHGIQRSTGLAAVMLESACSSAAKR